MRQPRWPSIGIELVQGLAAGAHVLLRRAAGPFLAGVQVLHEPLELLVVVGKELVQRSVEKPDDHRIALHDLQQLVEIRLLHGEQLCERLLAFFHRVGEDHLAEHVDPFFVEEHVLRAHEADALGPELARQRGIPRLVRVGPHVETA